MTTSTHILDELTAPQRALLDQYRFDGPTFESLRAKLSKGEFSREANRIDANLTPPASDELIGWPKPNSEAEHVGQRALDEGLVAAAILNGGMATRFGGVVKGVVEVLPNRSFLELKLSTIGRAAPSAPVFIMNSFATARDTRTHLESSPQAEVAPELLHYITQGISLRLSPEGQLFRTGEGEPSFYAPGHGDIFDALRTSPDFQAFVARGGRYIHVSNVDNLAATLSPRVIGAHILAGRSVSVEVAPKISGDKGGAPVEVDGHLEIVEGFRFPDDFDHDTLPVFNTNTLVINSEVFSEPPPLRWYRADKEVEEAPVVQFERLMGEITAFVDSTYLCVERDGPDGRFLPVKTPADLTELRDEIERRFG